MKLTPENIERFEVITPTTRPDDRFIVAKLCGDYEGILVNDNAGWSMVIDEDFAEVVETLDAGESEMPNGHFFQSVAVEGIRFRNDYAKGWICEEEEAE